MSNKLVTHLEVLKDKAFMSRSTSKAMNLTGVDNCTSRDYHEFQESLIALDS